MLVLSCKLNDNIVLVFPDGREATILFAASKPASKPFSKIRLGIAAPADVKVYRRDVWEKIKAGRGADYRLRKPAPIQEASS